LPIVGGGLQWERLPGDAKIVRATIVRLGERRALSAPYEWEGEDFLARSVIEMRTMLSDGLVELDPTGEAYRLLDAMRADCNRF
jgi:hypothetical protein